jgi:hypothetical protein
MKRMTCVLALVGAAVLFASPASAQSLTGTATTVEKATEPVVKPVTDTVSTATKPVTDTVSTATKPVTDTVSTATRPVTDTVSGATGGGGTSGGGTSGGGTSGGGDSVAGSGSGTSSGSTVNRQKCPPGEKQGAGGSGAAGGGGGGGGRSDALLTAAAAERVSAMQWQIQERKQGPGGSDTGVLGAIAQGQDDGQREGPLGIPLPTIPDEFPFSAGETFLLALLGLGIVGVLAGATSHMLGRVRSS